MLRAIGSGGLRGEAATAATCEVHETTSHASTLLHPISLSHCDPRAQSQRLMLLPTSPSSEMHACALEAPRPAAGAGVSASAAAKTHIETSHHRALLPLLFAQIRLMRERALPCDDCSPFIAHATRASQCSASANAAADSQRAHMSDACCLNSDNLKNECECILQHTNGRYT
jgi:hypothetical protein